MLKMTTDAKIAISSLNYLEANFVSVVQATLEDAARELKRMSALQTPVDTGELITSSVVRREGKSPSSVVVSLSYQAPHAFWVHERNLKYRHGKWRYLSDPTSDYQRNAAQRLRRHFLPRLIMVLRNSRGGAS